MGRTIDTSARQALLDRQPQPEPEDPATVHKTREDYLFEHRCVGTGEQAHIDRISRGEFLERIMELASEYGVPGGGEFVDLGSGTVTANVVSYISLVWPQRFSAIHAVDIAQDPDTMRDVMDMRLKVGGVHANVSAGMMRAATENTADIAWWTVTDESSVGMMFQPFAGCASRHWDTSVLFARASFIYSCDLKFKDAAVDAYREKIVESLVDSRNLLYVTCKEVGGRVMRKAEEGEWIDFVGKGTDDPHIGPYVQRVCKIVARGNVDVAWEDTVFYVVVIQGPNPLPNLEIAKTVLAEDDPTIKAIMLATARSVREAYKEVNKQTSLLDGLSGPGITSGPSLGYGELTEASMSKLIRLLDAGGHDDHIRVDSKSRIIDVGSGFGKPVLNFALTAPTCKSVSGVEILQHRHAASVNVVETLRGRSEAWRKRLENVFFIQGDASSPGFDYSPYSHIFMYDYVFDEQTHRRLFERISTDASFRVFITFCNTDKLRARGWPFEEVPLNLVFSRRLATTGGQRFTCYVYSREE